MTSQKLIDYESQEIENKSRVEYNFRENNIKFNVGISVEDAAYLNSTNRVLTSGDSIYNKLVETDLHFIKYGAFAQLSKTYLVDRLVTSIGFMFYGCSSIGRVVVSKTIGWEFESLHPCKKKKKWQDLSSI